MNVRIMHVGRITAGLLSVLVFAGCATIVGQSGPETLNIRSNPDQAAVSITDETGTKIFEGRTPTMLSLEKKKGYFVGKKYSVTLAKEGFSNYLTSVDTRVNGWYIGGNLVFGGLVGWLLVDPATGAMWTLEKNEINATLVSSPEVPMPKLDATGSVPAPETPETPNPTMVQAPQ